MLKPLQSILFILCFSTVLQAADPKPEEAAAPVASPAEKSGESDKLDIKVLEDKYWSAKDDDFSVIQNRAFTKEKRYFGSLTAGNIINDSFTTGTVGSVSGGYFFTERWGVELSYLSAQVQDNDTTKQILKLKGSPDYNKFKNSITLSGMFFPLYAKMSFLDKKILYFDMGISFGIGQTSYESVIDTKADKAGSSIHYALDLTQNVFFSQHWALRFDIKNRWGTQDLYKNYESNGGTGRKLAPLSVHDTNFVVGFTYFH